jgi:hypothetical protein
MIMGRLLFYFCCLFAGITFRWCEKRIIVDKNKSNRTKPRVYGIEDSVEGDIKVNFFFFLFVCLVHMLEIWKGWKSKKKHDKIVKIGRFFFLRKVMDVERVFVFFFRFFHFVPVNTNIYDGNQRYSRNKWSGSFFWFFWHLGSKFKKF